MSNITNVLVLILVPAVSFWVIVAIIISGDVVSTSINSMGRYYFNVGRGPSFVLSTLTNSLQMLVYTWMILFQRWPWLFRGIRTLQLLSQYWLKSGRMRPLNSRKRQKKSTPVVIELEWKYWSNSMFTILTLFYDISSVANIREWGRSLPFFIYKQERPTFLEPTPLFIE